MFNWRNIRIATYIILIFMIPLIVYMINPIPLLLQGIISLVFPFGFILIQIIIYIVVDGIRNREQEEYEFEIIAPDVARQIANVRNLRTTLCTATENAEVSVIKHPPKFSQISIGIDLFINAITALAVSYFIAQLKSASDGTDSDSRFIGILIIAYFIIGLLIMVTMKESNNPNNREERESAIQIANALGIMAILISFLILGEAVI